MREILEAFVKRLRAGGRQDKQKNLEMMELEAAQRAQR
jgi:hypothetical protein